ncbi:CPBP family intramembrane glutamic endopeptidase [Pseudanabaena sp. PCC 6802]|uniref:CPBP family intramembrane glutamic endopeptidase n=1 Tax=Pseudanabaena sp. PCC 6802 TaxID=118173 RepID=UPI000345D1E0
MDNMDNSPETPTMTRSQILFAMAVTAIVLLIIAKIWMYALSVSIVPLNLSFPNLLLGVGIGAAITLTSSLIYEFWAEYRKSADVYLEMVLKPLEMPDLIWLGLLPGISEELLFRGVALPGLGMNAIAVAISSIVFGSLHMFNLQQWRYALWAMAIGVCLGTMTLLTGSLFPAIVAHVLTNSVSGLIWKLKLKKGNIKVD